MIIYNASATVQLFDCDNYDYSGSHMGERKITATFQSPTAIDFNVGDYVEYYGEKFTLQTSPIVTRVYNSLMLQYTCTFWSLAYELTITNFIDVVLGDEPANTYFTGTGDVYDSCNVQDLVDRLKANLDRVYLLGGWTFNLGDLVNLDQYKDIVAENLSCWDVLLFVNTMFGLEFTIDKSRNVWIGYSPTGGAELKFGKDNGLCEINRIQNDQKIITRVYALGSNRNIPPDYRTGVIPGEYHPRLMLPFDTCPDGYLANATTEAIYGIREAFYINEDIYPTITSLDNHIKAVDTIVDRPLVDTPQYETVIVTPASYKKVWDTVLNEYITLLTPAVTKQILIPTQDYDHFTVYISGTLPDISMENYQSGNTAKMSFLNGYLQGMTFEISSYEKYITNINGVPTWDDGNGNQYYKVKLKRNSDDPNHIQPNSVVKPVAGDEFVFIDIFLPNIYVSEAETRLLTDTQAWLTEHSKSPEGYSVKVPEEYVQRSVDEIDPLDVGTYDHDIREQLKEGFPVTLTSDGVIVPTDTYILIQSITISYKEDKILPTYDLTVSQTPIKGYIKKIESGLKSATQQLVTNNVVTNNQINSMLKSVSITNSTILTNNGDINGDKIAPQTIYPTSLAIETKSIHYVLQATLYVNYQGNANSALGTAGILTHKEPDIVWGGVYDFEHQTWTITTPQTFTLDEEKYYWAYIKCDLSNGSAVWEISETRVATTAVQGYYMFEWGQINPSVDDTRFTENDTVHNPTAIAVGSEKYLTITQDQTLSFSPSNANGLISGGIVTWDNGLDFIVSPATYSINEEIYTTETTILTVSAADSDNPRLDIVIVDANSTVSIIEGIPAPNPILPVVQDPSTQIVLTSILIPAGIGIPEYISDTVIVYNENEEWQNGYSSFDVDTTMVVDFFSHADPFRQSYCIEVSNIGNRDYIYFLSTTALNFLDYTTLSFFIKLKEKLLPFTNVRLQFYLDTTPVSNYINVSLVNTIDDWQNFAINVSDFTIADPTATFDTIRMYLVKRDVGVYIHPGFYLDYVKLQDGLAIPINQDSLILEGDVTGEGKVGNPLQTQLKEIITAGQFGSSSKIPVITIDTKGRIVEIAEYSIAADKIESPVGDIDGVNMEFTLSNAPNENSYMVFLNGILQKKDEAFFISENKIYFTMPPFTNDWITVSYKYQP